MKSDKEREYMRTYLKAYHQRRKAEDPEWAAQQAANASQWKKDNPEKVREQNRRLYAKNPQKYRDAQRRYRERNLEKIREADRLRRQLSPEQYRERDRQWKLAHKEQMRAGQRRRSLKAVCTTPEDYDRMLAEQEGRCAICSSKPVKLEVDHDHQAKKARALLCGPCNRMLGMGRDNPDVLEAGAAYLRKHAA